jgi:hypothetical protein
MQHKYLGINLLRDIAGVSADADDVAESGLQVLQCSDCHPRLTDDSRVTGPHFIIRTFDHHCRTCSWHGPEKPKASSSF